MSTPLDRLLSAARSAVQHVRGRYQTEEPDYMDCLASALGQYEQAVRDPGYVVDEPVGTTADTVTPLAADPDCQWCAGAGYVHGDPGLGCPACDERQVIVDAFRAGAEYMRRSAHLRLTGRYQVVTLPDAERIDAAAAGYVEGLGR
jgi:hypothetical protein